MILPRRTGKGGLLVVICTAVDTGWLKDTLKPSSVGGLDIEGAVGSNLCGSANCSQHQGFGIAPMAIEGALQAPLPINKGPVLYQRTVLYFLFKRQRRDSLEHLAIQGRVLPISASRSSKER